jgi:adenylosuccinate lyase
MERTLDDSANRRLVLAEAFLCADGVLETLLEVVDGLVVHPAVIERHLRDELPFLASEDVLMAMVRAGGDRQELHERIRVHAQAAGDEVKRHGRDNDLLERLRGDGAFAAVREQLDGLLDPRRYVGRAPEQVRAFLEREVEPALAPYRDRLGRGDGLRV